MTPKELDYSASLFEFAKLRQRNYVAQSLSVMSLKEFVVELSRYQALRIKFPRKLRRKLLNKVSRRRLQRPFPFWN